MPEGDPSAPENAPVEPGTKMQDHAWSILPSAAPAQRSIPGVWGGGQRPQLSPHKQGLPALTPQIHPKTSLEMTIN